MLHSRNNSADTSSVGWPSVGADKDSGRTTGGWSTDVFGTVVRSIARDDGDRRDQGLAADGGRIILISEDGIYVDFNGLAAGRVGDDANGTIKCDGDPYEVGTTVSTEFGSSPSNMAILSSASCPCLRRFRSQRTTRTMIAMAATPPSAPPNTGALIALHIWVILREKND